YSIPDHKDLTRKALKLVGAEFTPSQKERLLDANASVDIENAKYLMMSPKRSPFHFHKGETRTANSLIKTYMDRAIHNETTEGALDALGIALHTAQDRYAHKEQDVPPGVAGLLTHAPLIGYSPDSVEKYPEKAEAAIQDTAHLLKTFFRKRRENLGRIDKETPLQYRAVLEKKAQLVKRLLDKEEGDLIDRHLGVVVNSPEKPRELKSWTEKVAQVDPYQQKTQWTCSAACFKAVLQHYGIKIPELAAIDFIGAQPNRGADTDDIVKAAWKLSLDAFEYSFASLDQAKVLLDQDIPIIADIQSFKHPGKGHYVVITKIDDGGVHLMDPNVEGNQRLISLQEMDERWWDSKMKPPHEHMPKWGVIILPPED
ncbi:MAG: cysteine peptidase family C39 domain-containing protein, partial [Methanoregulaceae archaeon]|nr:cysteine peptidase family C39 domain-containing protein [Methanoregulaceae archaeon]